MQVQGKSGKGHVHDQGHNGRGDVGACEEGDNAKEGLGHLCNIIYKGKWYMDIVVGEWVDVNYARRHDDQPIL